MLGGRGRAEAIGAILPGPGAGRRAAVEPVPGSYEPEFHQPVVAIREGPQAVPARSWERVWGPGMRKGDRGGA